MKKKQKLTLRKILIFCIFGSTLSIGLQFVNAERYRKAASERRAPFKIVLSFLPNSLLYQTEVFPQKAIDDFLNSDAQETSISEKKVSRKFAEFIQKDYKLDSKNNTYFAVLSFLDIDSVVVNAVMFFIFSIAYIVVSEIKEKRNASQSSNPT